MTLSQRRDTKGQKADAKMAGVSNHSTNVNTTTMKLLPTFLGDYSEQSFWQVCEKGALINHCCSAEQLLRETTHSFLHIYLKELSILKQEGAHKFRRGYSFSHTTQAGGSLGQPGLQLGLDRKTLSQKNRNSKQTKKWKHKCS